MKNNTTIKTSLIAPCGMNCALCLGYTREKNKCPGCRFITETNRISTVRCRIKNCEHLNRNGDKYCGTCGKYPCKRLKDLDKRYRTKYGMSMIDNLNSIQKNGIRSFVKNEKERWKCRSCGELLCVHRKECVNCGVKRINY
jgi:hypothetical protein